MRDKRRYHITITMDGVVIEFQNATIATLKAVRAKAAAGEIILNRAKRTDRTLPEK